MNQDEHKPSGAAETAEDAQLTPWQKEHQKYLAESDAQTEQVTETEAVEPAAESHAEAPQPSQGGSKLKVLLKPKTSSEDTDPTDPPKPSLQTVKDLPRSKSYADKLPKMKVERQHRLRKRLLVLVGSFTVAAVGMLYYVSPLSYLAKIQVVGNTHVTSEQVAAASQLTSNMRIWQALGQKGTVTKIKTANPRVKEAQISFLPLNNLKIRVAEFRETAYLKDKDLLHPVLENGKILNEPIEKVEKSNPILMGFKEGDSLNEFLAHFYEVESEVRSLIKEVKATPEKRNPFLVRLKMSDGNEVIASSKDYYTKMKYYPKVVSEMKGKGVIDMEAGIFATTFDELKKQKKTANSNENT